MAAIPPIIECARAARLAGWRGRDLVTAVAVAGAESAYRRDAGNDDFAQLFGNALALARAYNCNGVFAVGLWQIFIPVHRVRVRNMSGIDGACPQRTWLIDAENNARVAFAIWRDSGWTAWSVYTAGTYVAYWFQARDAINAEAGIPPEGLPPFVSLEHLAPVPLQPVD